MKRYLSVFGLAARSSFWKGLAVMVAAAAVAGLLLYCTRGGDTITYIDGNGMEQSYEDEYSLSELPEKSWMAAPLLLGLGGSCYVLAMCGGGKGAKPGYTMGRLQVRERTACLLWVLYDFMMLLLYWALAALTAFLVMSLRVRNLSDRSYIGPLSLIFSFYDSGLLHNLLPVGDVLAWIGNAVALLTCAVGCVDVAEKQWRGKLGGISLGIAVVLTAAGFSMNLRNTGTHLIFLVLQVFVLAITLSGWKGGYGDEDALDL